MKAAKVAKIRSYELWSMFMSGVHKLITHTL